MKKGILTIDDGPSTITEKIITYLTANKIPAVMFFLGENIIKYRKAARAAVTSGFLIGNHSYSHPHFSEIDLNTGIDEIKRTDEIIAELYRSCGVDDYPKLFRFPFLDRGGEHEPAIQEYLAANGYGKDTGITFDYQDYYLAYDQISFDEIYHNLENADFSQEHVHEIFLMHDHPQVEVKYESYYTKYIEKTMESGFSFVQMPVNR